MSALIRGFRFFVFCFVFFLDDDFVLVWLFLLPWLFVFAGVVVFCRFFVAVVGVIPCRSCACCVFVVVLVLLFPWWAEAASVMLLLMLLCAIYHTKKNAGWLTSPFLLFGERGFYAPTSGWLPATNRAFVFCTTTNDACTCSAYMRACIGSTSCFPSDRVVLNRLGVKEENLAEYYRRKEENYRKVGDTTTHAHTHTRARQLLPVEVPRQAVCFR